MANMLPPVKGSAFQFYTSLVSIASPNVFQTSVTLAAGDVLYFGDGATGSNVDILPVEIGTTGVLSCCMAASEMNYDCVAVRFHDVSGSEWQDQLISIYTAAQTFDTMDANIDSILTDTGNGVALSGSALGEIAASLTGVSLAASDIWAVADRTITGGSISDITTAAGSAIADSFLTRDWTEITASVPDRSSLNALRFLRNKWSVSGTTMTVTKEDDLAKAWEASLTSSSSASPVTGMTPA